MQLERAAANGSISIVKELLKEGANIDQPGNGACSIFFERICILTLTNALDGTTPLCAAALWGHRAMVQFLLSNNANINAKNEGL